MSIMRPSTTNLSRVHISIGSRAYMVQLYSYSDVSVLVLPSKDVC